MKYSIKILEEEKAMMKKCLSNWDKEHYPEAHKERMGRLKDLDAAIKLIQKQEGVTFRNEPYKTK